MNARWLEYGELAIAVMEEMIRVATALSPAARRYYAHIDAALDMCHREQLREEMRVRAEGRG